MYKHILIATDGSDFSAKSLEHGLGIAKSTGCDVTVMTVTKPYSLSGLTGTRISEQSVEDYNNEWKEFAAAILSAAQKTADAANVQIKTLHQTGISPASIIIETAEDYGCDLIIMGSHGRRGMKRLLLGSQANEVLQLSKIPVLVVK
ncbi:universal stress protein [Pseudochrobactrum sp. HB0163]|uniref:universal stress protein n=1 Tax=Pseudochrobactrum sp. HB0163 TaxID=3450708 RepID=UPI003F6DC63A